MRELLTSPEPAKALDEMGIGEARATALLQSKGFASARSAMRPLEKED